MKWIALTALCLGLAAASGASATTSALASIDQVGAGGGTPDMGAAVTQVAMADVVMPPDGGVPNVIDVTNNPTDQSTIDQTGVSQVARLLQTGANDVSTITQSGFSQTALVSQSGDNDVSVISQSGSQQYARVDQYGADDYSSITQSGQGNQAFVSQFSNGARSVIVQSGSNNIATVRQ